MFGENLTMDDLEESKMHVGDVFKVGSAILEVTKPRQSCMKLEVPFNSMKIVKQFWKQDFPGVYFKVLRIGKVQVGGLLEPVKSCSENTTIREVYLRKRKEKAV